MCPSEHGLSSRNGPRSLPELLSLEVRNRGHCEKPSKTVCANATARIADAFWLAAEGDRGDGQDQSDREK